MSLLKLAVFFEGILAMIFLIEKSLNKSFQFFLPGLNEVLFALLLSQLLFVFNSILVRASFKREWGVFQDFITEMIYPLASQLGIFSALVVSLFAGVGEELFFRGIILKQFLENYSVRKSLTWSSIILRLFHKTRT